jgi:hypothetical protein
MNGDLFTYDIGMREYQVNPHQYKQRLSPNTTVYMFKFIIAPREITMLLEFLISKKFSFHKNQLSTSLCHQQDQSTTQHSEG